MMCCMKSHVKARIVVVGHDSPKTAEAPTNFFSFTFDLPQSKTSLKRNEYHGYYIESHLIQDWLQMSNTQSSLSGSNIFIFYAIWLRRPGMT